MKYTKSINGDIGFVDTKCKLCYKDAIKKIPKDARIMKAWECMKLFDEDYKAFRNIPKGEEYFIYGTEKYFRLGRVDDFGDGSNFEAIDWYIDVPNSWLRGVLIVKKVKQK